MNTDQPLPACARCPFQPPERICQNADGKAPPFCPTLNKNEVVAAANCEFEKPEILEFARQASIQEGEGYAGREQGYDHVRPLNPRIQEIIEFAGKMKYRRLGFAFCMGLRKEAAVVEKLLSEGQQLP